MKNLQWYNKSAWKQYGEWERVNDRGEMGPSSKTSEATRNVSWNNNNSTNFSSTRHKMKALPGRISEFSLLDALKTAFRMTNLRQRCTKCNFQKGAGEVWPPRPPSYVCPWKIPSFLKIRKKTRNSNQIEDISSLQEITHN